MGRRRRLRCPEGCGARLRRGTALCGGSCSDRRAFPWRSEAGSEQQPSQAPSPPWRRSPPFAPRRCNCTKPPRKPASPSTSPSMKHPPASRPPSRSHRAMTSFLTRSTPHQIPCQPGVRPSRPLPPWCYPHSARQCRTPSQANPVR